MAAPANEITDLAGVVPVIDMHLEQTLAGERRVLSWSAYRVTDNGQVLGALCSLPTLRLSEPAVPRVE